MMKLCVSGLVLLAVIALNAEATSPPAKCSGGKFDLWREGCRWCYCSNNKPVCKPRTCTAAQLEYSKCMGECVGRPVWWRDCNSCRCVDGRPSCTEKNCDSNPPCTPQQRASCPEYRQLEYMLVKGCKPIYKPNKCCAVGFRCIKNFEEKLKGKCYYLGKWYNAGDSVPSANPCRPACRCQGPGVTCATVRCASKPGCYQTYTLGTCCPTGGKCADDKTPRCVYNGRTFLDGQRMSFDRGPLSDTCQECICSGSYSGPFGPGCRKRYCGHDLTGQSQILAGCVPIFEGNRCCSLYSFLCPSSDKVVPGQGSSTGGKNKCKFGNIFLNIGESLQLTDTNMKCKCFTPPDILCKRPDGPR